MKTLFIILLFVNALTIAQNSASIDEGDQTITWIGKAAVGNYAPEGTLDIMSANINFTGNSIEQLTLVVDMRTLEQENTQLRDHLKEKDFFHIKKFPVASFILSESVTIENNEAVLIGKMTIRGTAQTEMIPVKISQEEGQIIISFNHIMDRTLYGVNHNSPSIFKKLKENAIADDFVLKGDLVFKID